MKLSRAKYTVIEKGGNFSICEESFLRKNPHILMGNSKTLFVFYVEYDREEFDEELFNIATSEIDNGYHNAKDKEVYIKENNNRVFKL